MARIGSPVSRIVDVVVMLFVMSGFACSATEVSHAGDKWLLENGQVRVTVDPQSGTLAVLEKAAGHKWKQMPGDQRR